MKGIRIYISVSIEWIKNWHGFWKQYLILCLSFLKQMYIFYSRIGLLQCSYVRFFKHLLTCIGIRCENLLFNLQTSKTNYSFSGKVVFVGTDSNKLLNVCLHFMCTDRWLLVFNHSSKIPNVFYTVYKIDIQFGNSS